MSQKEKPSGPMLIQSIERNHLKLFYYLLSKDFDVDYREECKYAWNRGYTTLMLTCEKNMLQETKALISAGCNLDLKSRWEDTALMIASKFGNTEIIRELIVNGCNPNLGNITGRTALMNAKNLETLTVLIENGCDLETEDHFGDTALIKFAESMETSFVSALIYAGCKLDTQGCLKRTALVRACRYVCKGGNTCSDAIQSLLKGGCDPFIKDYKGKIAVDYCTLPHIKSMVTDGMRKFNNENFKKMCLILKMTKDSDSKWYGLPLDVVKIVFKLSRLSVYKFE